MRKRKNPLNSRASIITKIDIGVFVAKMCLIVFTLFISGCAKDEEEALTKIDPLKLAGIDKIFPANLADSVDIDPVVEVLYNNEITAEEISKATLTLKQGSAIVAGNQEISGSSVLFKTSADLSPELEYTALVKTMKKNTDGSYKGHEYSWRFRTGKNKHSPSLAVASVTPQKGTQGVDITVQPTVTFNKIVSSSMIGSIKIVIKQNGVTVPGSVTFSDATATFKPASALKPNTVYTGYVSIGSSYGDDDDDDDDGSNQGYFWSFTTAGATDILAPTIASVNPVNSATAVQVNTKLTVVFSESMAPLTVNTSTFILKGGITSIPGTVVTSGNTSTFTPAASLEANTVYSATITKGAKDLSGNAIATDYTWNFTTGVAADIVAPKVLSVLPANASASVAPSSKVVVNFSEAMDPATITSGTVTLKLGTANVSGTVTYSGTAATFTPSAPLANSTIYSATVSTSAKDAAGNSLAAAYSWSFTTSAAADIVAPKVLSVLPANAATSVVTSSKVVVNFSEAMDPSTITSGTVTLKLGTANVAGTVTYSGTAATFTPSAPLANNTLYSAIVSTSAKDAAGNSLAAIYSWSFTTIALADLTPPSIISVIPVTGATSVAVNGKVSVTFSEAMNASTLTASSFKLMKGTTSVSGTISYSGSVATFTPASALTGSTVYTASITTAASDLAGNALASNFVWTFTTVAVTPVPTGVSFSGEVVPILNLCNTCHKHPWTTSTTASVFYTNLVNEGYVVPASPASGKIYNKLSGGHPGGSTVTTAQVNTILTWMNQGSKNN
jgi:hypothetical protein